MSALSFGVFTAIASNTDASGDKSANAVIRGGTADINILRSKYDSDATPGTKAIFSHMGITSNVIHKSHVRVGYVTKSGAVLVNGKTVATNATTTGRQYMAGSTKQNAGGVTFYTRAPAVSFRSKQIKALVFSDIYGKFLGAVLLDCGNPVKAVPVPPAPKKVKACDTRTYSVVTITEEQLKSQKYYTADHANCAAPCAIEGKEDLKADDPACKEEPKCVIEGKTTLDATDPLCKEDPKCTVKGKETLKASDAKCKETPKCTVSGKEDILATDPACKEDPKCTITGKETLKANDPACKADPMCKLKDKETLKATDPKCKKEDPKCTVKGKETLKASDAKCKEEPKCKIKDKESLAANDPKCKQPVEKIKVCDLNKDVVVEINKTSYNEKDYDKDIEACGEEEKPAPKKVVKELPKSGPVEDALSSVGIGAIAAASYYLYASRRSL